jgi:hypothetical protein
MIRAVIWPASEYIVVVQAPNNNGAPVALTGALCWRVACMNRREAGLRRFGITQEFFNRKHAVASDDVGHGTPSRYEPHQANTRGRGSRYQTPKKKAPTSANARGGRVEA